MLGGSCPGLGPAEWLSRRRRLPDYSFLLQSQRGFLKDVCFPPSSFFFFFFLFQEQMPAQRELTHQCEQVLNQTGLIQRREAIS